MDYLAAFAISASGMAVERTRLDTTAINIANANSTRAADGSIFRPLRVVSGTRTEAGFASLLGRFTAQLGGAEVKEVRSLDVAMRMVHEPGHPDADARGFVAYPGINPVAEMVNLTTAVRSYEANVVALNAAKTMAQRALEIGGNR